MRRVLKSFDNALLLLIWQLATNDEWWAVLSNVGTENWIVSFVSCIHLNYTLFNSHSHNLTRIVSTPVLTPVFTFSGPFSLFFWVNLWKKKNVALDHEKTTLGMPEYTLKARFLNAVWHFVISSNKKLLFDVTCGYHLTAIWIALSNKRFPYFSHMLTC